MKIGIYIQWNMYYNTANLGLYCRTRTIARESPMIYSPSRNQSIIPFVRWIITAIICLIFGINSAHASLTKLKRYLPKRPMKYTYILYLSIHSSDLENLKSKVRNWVGALSLFKFFIKSRNFHIYEIGWNFPTGAFWGASVGHPRFMRGSPSLSNSPFRYGKFVYSHLFRTVIHHRSPLAETYPTKLLKIYKMQCRYHYYIFTISRHKCAHEDSVHVYNMCVHSCSSTSKRAHGFIMKNYFFKTCVM